MGWRRSGPPNYPADVRWTPTDSSRAPLDVGRTQSTSVASQLASFRPQLMSFGPEPISVGPQLASFAPRLTSGQPPMTSFGPSWWTFRSPPHLAWAAQFRVPGPYSQPVPRPPCRVRPNPSPTHPMQVPVEPTAPKPPCWLLRTYPSLLQG